MEIKKFVYVLLSLTILFLSESVTGTSNNRLEKYGELCSQYDQMTKIGLPEEELEKLFENMLKSEMNNIQGKQNSDVLKGGKPMYTSYSDDVKNDVMVQSEDKIGEYGQLVRSVNVGNGESTGTYGSAVSIVQGNQHFSGSDVKLIVATIEAAISAFKKHAARSEKNNSPNFLLRKGRKSCQNMIDDAYKRLVKEINSEKSVSFSGSKFGSEMNSDSSSRSGKNYNEQGGNTTLVDNQASIGPDGYATNVINVATGEASNTGTAFLIDFQSHGKYQDSSADLFKITASTPVSMMKADSLKKIPKK